MSEGSVHRESCHMNQSSEYFLTTGEFAKMCNTTRDTLRHYQEIGLITPQKNEENGYYYYSLSQVTSFYFINLFRQLDTPLSSIKFCLETADESAYYHFCRGQLNSLVQMRTEINRKIVALSNASMLMHQMKHTPEGIPHIFSFQEKTNYYRTHIESANSRHAADIADDIRRHIEVCNRRPEIYTFPISATIDYEDFRNGNYQYKHLCSSTSAKPNGTDIFEMPTTRVVGCSCKDGSTDIRTIYKKLQDYIDENKIAVISNLFSINLFNFVDNQSEHRYLKYIFFCIDENS